jgi:plastocyanin
MRLQLLTLAIATALLGWWSCGESTAANPIGGDTIALGSYYFAPMLDSVVAASNDSVNMTFLWTIGNVDHNVTWDTGPGTTLPANSPTKSDGVHVVNLGLGTYTYHCTIHLVDWNMSGTIVVYK